MGKQDRLRPGVFLVVTAVLSIVYTMLAVIGDAVLGPGALFWPTAGFAVAAILSLGARRASPGIALGAMLTVLWHYVMATPSPLQLADAPRRPGLAVLVTVAVLLQSWIAAYLCRRTGVMARILQSSTQPFQLNVQQLQFFVNTALRLIAVAALAALAGAVLATVALLGIEASSLSDALICGGVWWGGSLLGIVVLTAPLTLLAHRIQHRQLNQGTAVLVMDVGFISSVLLFLMIWRLENQRIVTEFAGRAAALQVQLGASMAAPYHDLESLRAFAQASANISRSEFARFVQPHLYGRNATPGVLAFEWAPIVTTRERTAFEAEMQAAGFTGFTITELDANAALRLAATHPFYTVVKYRAAISDADPIDGLDLATEPTRRDAMERAMATGAIAATALLPVGADDAPGILLFAPVNRSTAEADDAAAGVAGFMVGAYRIDRLVEAALAMLETQPLSVYLFDTTEPAAPQLLFTNSAISLAGLPPESGRLQPKALQTGLFAASPLEIAGRRWLLIVRPASGHLNVLSLWTPWAVLLAGVTLTYAVGHLFAQRQQTADELRRQHLLLQTVIDSTPDWIFIKDRSHRYRLVNQGYADSLGVTPTAAIGKNDLELGFAPAAVMGDAQTGVRGFWADDREVIERGVTKVIPVEPVQLHGRQMFLHTIKAPIRSPDGAIWGVLGYVHDITELKAAEIALQRRTTELTLLLEASRALSATLDLHTVYTILNRTLRQWMSCDTVIVAHFDPPAQLLRCAYYADGAGEKDVTAFPPQPLAPAGQDALSRAIRSGQSVLLHNDVQLTAGSACFVSEYPGNEKEISVDADLYRSAILAPLTVDGEVAGVLQILHRQPDAFQEEHLHFVEALIYRVTGIIANVRLFQRLQDELLERRRAETQVRLLNAELEQRVMERTQDLTRALRAKDEFLATMSHELRTPLTSILALAEMLGSELRGPLNPHQRKYVANIDSSGRHLLSMINDILDLAKVEAGRLNLQLTPVNVDDVCRASLSMIKELATQKNLQISYHCSDASLVILADATRLKQMLVNLLGNAVKFTAAGGRVALEVGVDSARQVVEFAVQDTGIGIAATDIPRLFKPFTQLDAGLTRQHEGTGLGLALVKRLAELHDGAVSVISEGVAGKGSRFTITLPWRRPIAEDDVPPTDVTPASLPSSASPSDAVLPSDAAPLILVAEDNPMNQDILRELLQAGGYRVETANNGVEALQHAQVSSPDLILMDIQMPEMDGLEATRRLRQLSTLATTPIIAITAFTRPEDIERCRAAGVTDFLSKPFTIEKLRARVAQYLPGGQHG